MSSKIVVIGEAWGEKEAEKRQPFVGPSGGFLKATMREAGLDLADCYFTNVFNLQPQPKNDIKNLCGPKAEGIPGMPALVKGKYVNARYTSELTRLYLEINTQNPNLIIALGSTAVWALTGIPGIKAVRGSALGTSNIGRAATGISLSRTFKILPTYHPSAVLRDYSLRPIVLADFDKALRFADTPEIIRPSRKLWIEPTLRDFAIFEADYIMPSPILSIDIETIGEQITCIGFAPSPSIGLVLPFWSQSAPDGNYWPDVKSELTAWSWVRRWCKLKKSVFQNGLYDINRLWRTYGITCNLADDDTMLLHHALQPEMEKGLAFLASVHTDEASWKFMSKSATQKKED